MSYFFIFYQYYEFSNEVEINQLKLTFSAIFNKIHLNFHFVSKSYKVILINL